MKTKHNRRFFWLVVGSLSSAVGVVLLGVALLLVSSCGISKKAKSSYSVKTDSVSVSNLDSSAYSINNETTAIDKDSAGQKTETDIETYSKEEVTHTDIYLQGDTATINIVFGNDSGAYYEDKDKVIRLQMTDGVLVGQFITKPKTIPANGYKKESGTKATKKTDNTAVNTKENTTKAGQEAVNVSRGDSVVLKQDAKSKEKNKTAFQLPWYAYLIGVLVLLFLLYRFYNRSKGKINLP